MSVGPTDHPESEARRGMELQRELLLQRGSVRRLAERLGVLEAGPQRAKDDIIGTPGSLYSHTIKT